MIDYCQIIISAYPKFKDAQLKVLTHSWDSVAVDVDNQFIFKFPKNAKAERALRMEVKLLGHIRPRVALPVPDMTLHYGPPVFSQHRKIQGEHLENFDALSEPAKNKLAQTLGKFYAQLHKLDKLTMQRLGAVQLAPWGNPDEILRRCLERLPLSLHHDARMMIATYVKLSPDPFGDTYGFFDGHGWNMAFDHATETLIGLYDFADSGIGPLHQEFVYTSLTSPDLAYRIMAAYGEFSGRQIDYNRVNTLTGMHRLYELAQVDANTANIVEKIRQISVWQTWAAKSHSA